MTETPRQFVEIASRNIDKIFRMHGVIRPMWHAVTRDGEELIFPAPSPDKDTAVVMVRVLFELRDVVRYALIDEAWIVAAFGDATPAQLEAVRQAAITGATASPHREEVVMFVADDASEGSLMARRKIIRPPSGRATLGPLEYDPRGGIIAGRFLGLVPRKNATLQ